MDSASDPERIFGWIAVSLSLVYKFPQIYKLAWSKDTRGISVFSQIVQASAYFFYIAHGLIIGDPPIVFLGITSLCQSLILVAQYFAFRGNSINKEKTGDLEEGRETDSDSSGDSGSGKQEVALSIDSESKQGDKRSNDLLLLSTGV